MASGKAEEPSNLWQEKKKKSPVLDSGPLKENVGRRFVHPHAGHRSLGSILPAYLGGQGVMLSLTLNTIPAGDRCRDTLSPLS